VCVLFSVQWNVLKGRADMKESAGMVMVSWYMDLYRGVAGLLLERENKTEDYLSDRKSPS
jgi:hypothetical protein